MKKEVPITEFDRFTLPESIHFIKALLPYMEYDIQRTLSSMIRYYELKSTISYYNNPKNSILQTYSKHPIISFNASVNDIISNDEIMNTLLKYCPENYQNLFNSIKAYSKMSDLFNLTNQFSSEDTNVNNLKNLLNQGQQKMYDDYIKQLDNIDI